MRSDEAKKSEPTAAVFRTERGQLYAGDAVEWLRAMADASVDLVFADPPYNAGRESWDSFDSDRDYLTWSATWIREAARVLRPSGSLYVCGFSEELAQLSVVARPHFDGCRWLVWYYRNKANLGRDWGRSHESVLHLRRPDFHLNVDEARVPYNSHTLRYPEHPQAATSRYGGDGRRYVWRPHPLGAKPRDVIEVPTLTNGMREKVAHPTQKPLELVRRLIAAATKPADTVVDPFGGSGTTYVACELLGRRWLGCEREEAYRQLTIERLRDSAGQLSTVDIAQAEQRRREQRGKLR